MSTVVIRYSSLGDIVLTGAVTGALAPVTYLTHPRFAPLAALLPGVEAVCTDPRACPRADRIIDLHASLRSFRAALSIRGPVRRVRRHDLRRRARVHLKLGAPPPTVVQRYAEAAGVTPAPAPWIPVPQAAAEALLLCPGSAWPTKAWAPERFIALGQRYDGPVIVLGGPGESELVHGIAAKIGRRAEGIAERGFERTLAALGRGRAAVAGDSGLMHLCAAAGVPVIGLFGPTTSADGFWCHRGEVVELPLPCRPCSRHGGPACPFGDHRCMVDLSVELAWAAVERALA